MSATIHNLERQLNHLTKAFNAQKADCEDQMKKSAKEKDQAIQMRDQLEHVQTQWERYERKLKAKRELLETRDTKLKEVEEEHLGCIERQMKDRKEIEALQRVVTVEIQKHLEKDTLARKLEWEKVRLEQNLADAEHRFTRLHEEKRNREAKKKARYESKKSGAIN